mgnify:CR=1 FL=1
MKVGLALSGGGIRGLAHAGVLKALEENNIKIDIIGGTSAGSMVASLYAIGYKPEEIYREFKENSNKIIGKGKFSILNGVKTLINYKSGLSKGFKNGQGIEEVFENLANQKNIDKISKIKMPIVIPSVDIKDSKEYIFTNKIPIGEGEEKYITDITVGKAVRASSSFPAVFNLCNINSHAFMDGGALNNVPVVEVRKQGADKVIAVKFEGDKIDETSSVMDIVMKTIDIMGNKIIEEELNSSDYIVNICTEKMGLLEINKLKECYQIGYDTVIKNIDKIKKIIEN